jgi:hypothetical protein
MPDVGVRVASTQQSEAGGLAASSLSIRLLGLAGSADRRNGIAVLRPGLLVVAQGCRAVLAIADRADPRIGNAASDQIIATGVGATLAKREVVLLGSAIVGIAGDLHVDLRIFGEPARLPIERRARIRFQRRAVEVKKDTVADIGDKVLLTARDGTRGCRASAGRGASVLIRARRQQGDGGQSTEDLAVHATTSLVEGDIRGRHAKPADR